MTAGPTLLTDTLDRDDDRHGKTVIGEANEETLLIRMYLTHATRLYDPSARPWTGPAACENRAIHE